jgi:hypothetical protein
VIRYVLKLCALTFALVAGLVAGAAGWELTNDPYNRFANAYNAFIASQDRGVLDLKKLHKMRAAWRDLEKSAGWPDEAKR